MNKFYVTWDQFDEHVQALAFMIENHGYDHIVGLSRGGLPIAVKLSNLTGIPMTPITWQTRDGFCVQDKQGLQAIELNFTKILVVDDICDSGLTFKQVREYLPGASYCSMVTKKVDDVDYASIFMEGDNRWVVFPWGKPKAI